MGIDIGGSHFTSGFVNLNQLKIYPQSLYRVELGSDGSAEEIIFTWARSIEKVLHEKEFDGTIGIAFPGPFDYKNGISKIKTQGKFQNLYGKNIKLMLSEKLNLAPSQITFVNDAACFLQGEITCGVAQSSQTAIGLTLGTGLGSAIYTSGKSSDAALWESNFREGIAEDYFSTAWFLKQFKDRTGQEALGVQEIAILAEGSEALKKLFAEFGENLGDFLLPLIENIKPDTIILGGNIAKSSHLFLPSLTYYLKKYSALVEVKVTELGEWATIVGAASFSHNQSKK
ncbi:ROK family protein [Litoribacter populi]|uniref:ROK family protein n=1 Tax=Litoribacter populi TaxID=2598460 RepID=UPI00163D4F42|nr:ROK family protein [Litoribacter populi]